MVGSMHSSAGDKELQKVYIRDSEDLGGIRVDFDSSNARKLRDLAVDVAFLSGKNFSSYKETFKMALDLLTLLVELQKKGGELVAKTSDGKETKLIIRKT